MLGVTKPRRRVHKRNIGEPEAALWGPTQVLAAPSPGWGTLSFASEFPGLGFGVLSLHVIALVTLPMLHLGPWAYESQK